MVVFCRGPKERNWQNYWLVFEGALKSSDNGLLSLPITKQSLEKIELSELEIART